MHWIFKDSNQKSQEKAEMAGKAEKVNSRHQSYLLFCLSLSFSPITIFLLSYIRKINITDVNFSKYKRKCRPRPINRKFLEHYDVHGQLIVSVS